MTDRNDIMISDGDMSATVTTIGVNLGLVTAFSVQTVFSGSPAGILTLEGSNNNSTYTKISGSDQVIAAAGDHIWDYRTPGFGWVRMKFVPTSGTGSISATFVGKAK